jgi:hypothetical protein
MAEEMRARVSARNSSRSMRGKCAPLICVLEYPLVEESVVEGLAVGEQHDP